MREVDGDRIFKIDKINKIRLVNPVHPVKRLIVSHQSAQWSNATPAAPLPARDRRNLLRAPVNRVSQTIPYSRIDKSLNYCRAQGISQTGAVLYSTSQPGRSTSNEPARPPYMHPCRRRRTHSPS